MRQIVGVVCEFDPFHRGHQRLFDAIRAAFPGCAIVCAMSGAFTQRGEAALLAPATRAKMALLGGADAVVELPAAFAVRDAERFALGGVSMLSRLGCDVLAFGCERGELSTLFEAAHLLESEPERVFEKMKPALQRGESYARAQGDALTALLGTDAPEQPNDVLALCYLRAILRLGIDMQPFCVKREGEYHGNTLDGGFPSATAVRTALLRGEDVSDAIPAPSLTPLTVDMQKGRFCRPDALDRALLLTLRAMDTDALAALPDCSEGLDRRLDALCREATSREALLASLKTKRYPYARLSRLCCHALLSMTDALLSSIPLPPYARLLGFREDSAELLTQLERGGIPLIAKAADADRASLCWQLDERAYDLWALGADQPAGLCYTQGVTIIPRTRA